MRPLYQTLHYRASVDNVRHMDIKFGALINVTATLASATSLGNTVMLNLTVKGKTATISMTKQEAEQMRAFLANALK